ncbi:MAG: response regulator [Chloroflexi bacterium]|nr:response regulator [Chloroflexota bacterium]
MPTERVLVVDDDPVILTLCQRILEVDGYHVTSVKRGEDALAKLDSETFDVLLTDIRLPGLNGLEVTTRLRERGLELVVITMTGYSNMEMAIQALTLGVDEFIIKPFSPDTLRVHVARALEKAYLRRENLRLRTLVPLLQTAQAFAEARTRDQVIEILFDAVETQLHVKDMTLALLNADENTLTVSAVQGAHLAESLHHTFLVSQLVEPEMLLSNVLQVWDQSVQPRLPLKAAIVGWLTSVALQTRDRTLGLLLLETPALSPSNMECLHLIAAQAAAAMESVDLIAEISRTLVTVRELGHLKSEFINIAGHELRTPLAVILGYAKLLQDRLDGEPREFAGEVMRNAERLHRITDDMLNLKYLENGLVQPNLEPCGIKEIVRDVVNAYRPLAAEKEQSIEVNIAEQVGELSADRAMLDLILGSVLSNAIKFSPRKTRVCVGAEGNADVVTLIVQDQGKGLTPEEAARVFEPFYQAGDSLTRQEGGIGLGLTLTREMVHAHGGKIWVESQYNRGSSFYIMLPRNGHPRKGHRLL